MKLRLFAKKNPLEEINELEQLNPEEKTMIRGIVELSGTLVRSVMIPRVDIISASEENDLAEVVSRFRTSGFSRIPLYSRDGEEIIGILYSKDIMFYLYERTLDVSLAAIARKPYFVPEAMRLDTLLREFQTRKVHQAVVVDEYGGVSGIVCLEDIMEEIVGDIQDEFDQESDDITTLEDGSFLCLARVPLEDLVEKIGLPLPGDGQNFETLGGLVFDLFGRIPRPEESIEYEGYSFTVEEIEGHKIKKIRVRLKVL